MKLTRLNEIVEDGKTIKGRWEIGPNHEIQYRSLGKNDEIKVKASLVAAEPGALVISVDEKQWDQNPAISTVGLSGKWRADEKNRIVFEVEKQSGKKDVLAFQGGWTLNENQEVVYGYTREDLKTKRKETQKLVFKGDWELSDKNKLTYWLGADSESVFRFRGAFQTKSLFAKKNEIRYQIGMEAGGKGKIQTVTFFGQWKISKELGISFEIESGPSHGRSVTITKDFFGGDGGAFIRFQKSVKESSFEAGVKIRF